ncbi:MAG: fibronectin type III domain-containing protein, partial [Candidatus Omnitrophica bacterium]|nr:fibronectin type III domain-containing protein [Candidatus Omnitrophota bacterium]
VQVYESGSYINDYGSYTAGDVLEVSRSGTTVTYLKNSSVFYTSNVSSTGTFLIDVGMSWNGATIDDARWTNLSARAPGNIGDLNVVPADESVILDWSAPGDNGSAITEYEVQYGTITSGTFGSTLTDNAFPGATVPGLTNNVGYQFRVVAKNAVGTGNPSNVVYETPGIRTDVVWTDIVGATVSGTTLSKSASTGWVYPGGAISNTSYAGDVAIDLPRTDQWEHSVGLSLTNTNNSWNTIDYSFYVSSTDVYVIELGATRYDTPIEEGDTLQIKRVGTSVTYYKNHELIYTSGVSSTGTLMVDAGLYWQNGKVEDVQLFNISGIPEITTVSHSPTQIDPAVPQSTTISFTLAEDADVTVDIYSAHYDSLTDSYSRTHEDTVLSNDSRTAGSNTFVWDGKDSGGGELASGVY